MWWSSGDNVTGDGDGVVGGSKWCGIGGWWGLLPPWYGRRLATLHPGTLLLQLCTHQPTDESSLMTYYDPSAPHIDTDHQWLALAWPEKCYWPIIKGWLNVIKILQYTVYSTILYAKFWWTGWRGTVWVNHMWSILNQRRMSGDVGWIVCHTYVSV